MMCHEIKELTVPYLELDLEPSRVRDITAHLEGCADAAPKWRRSGRSWSG